MSKRWANSINRNFGEHVSDLCRNITEKWDKKWFWVIKLRYLWKANFMKGIWCHIWEISFFLRTMVAENRYPFLELVPHQFHFFKLFQTLLHFCANPSRSAIFQTDHNWPHMAPQNFWIHDLIYLSSIQPFDSEQTNTLTGRLISNCFSILAYGSTLILKIKRALFHLSHQKHKLWVSWCYLPNIEWMKFYLVSFLL